MMRATLVSLALLVGGGSVAFAEDPMPAEQTAPAAAPAAEKADAPKAETGKKHHKNKARNKKPSAKKHHKHHAKKAK